MSALINIGGRQCIKVEEVGYMNLQDYLAMKQIEQFPKPQPPFGICSGCYKKRHITNRFCSTCNKKVNFMRIAENTTEVLSRDEVLEMFILYIKKYKSIYTIFDIPVGDGARWRRGIASGS